MLHINFVALADPSANPMKKAPGGKLLCSTLENLGVKHVFGLPGSQNVEFFEALRQSSLRTILANHELAAAFMANGYYRASGKVGVLTTIPGPGFAYTVAAIAEASLDSSAILYIAGKPPDVAGKKFNRQSIDQRAILGPLVRRIVEVDRTADLVSGVREAYAATTAGEPGPVMLHLDPRAVSGEFDEEAAGAAPVPVPRQPDSAQIEQAIQLLESSRRPVFFVGQGANDGARHLLELAELLQAPVIATRSSRGVFPENHALALTFVSGEGSANAFNSLLERSDLIVAIGCKFSQNGTYGFRLRLPQEKLIHVDASSEVLNANYPAKIAIHADAPAFLRAVLRSAEVLKSRHSEWSAEELAGYKKSGAEYDNEPEPHVHGVNPPTPAAFFTMLRRVLPYNSCLVTDSGSHQVLAGRHFRAHAPRGLVTPSDFQSMGFGLPSAIGAKLAQPDKPVVALIGDGGLHISAMEMVTGIREQIPLTVIVFNDGFLGQIRLQQFSRFGRSHATELLTPDLALLAQAIGADYLYFDGDAENTLRQVVAGDSVTLVEVSVGDSNAIRLDRAKGLVRHTARRALKGSIFGWMKSRRRS
jgi:acetolactate synthase-1/2/3 large subunit